MIAGMGFAQMAWKEANRRHGTTEFWPHPRIEDHFMSNTEIEFFRICDNAEQGFIAGKVARKLKMISDAYTVRL